MSLALHTLAASPSGPSRRALVGLGLAAAVSAPRQAQAATTLTVGGVGAAMPLMQRLAEAYERAHPGTRVAVVLPPLGSAGALRALAASRLDLAVIGRPLQLGEAVVSAPWLRTPLVFATSDGVLSGLDAARLEAVYTGQLTRWDDGRPLRLVLRGAQESETLILRSLSPGLDRAVGSVLERRDLPMPGDDLEALEFLARIPGSFGTSAYGLVQMARPAALRLLAWGGVAPGLEALAEGRYPLARAYLLARRPDAPAAVARFIDFLRSTPSLRLARALGHLDVDR
jgi:phosphate transport system substrate-binding protein